MPWPEKSHALESSHLLDKQRRGASASHGNGVRKHSRRLLEEVPGKRKYDAGIQSTEKSPDLLTSLEGHLMQYVNGIGLTFFFWCLGGLSLMVCLIVYCNNEWSDNNWGLENPKLQKWLHHYSVIMLFFGIGDIVAAWALARLLLGAYTLSVFKAEQMDAYQDMLSDNSDRGSEVCSSTGAPRSFSSKGCRMIVPYDIGLSNWRLRYGFVPVPNELWPMIRHMIFRGCGGTMVITLLTITQILVCYHLSRPEKEGSIYLITSTLPVIILLSIELLRSILTYSVGVPEMLSWLLLLIQTIIIGIRSTGRLSHLSWYILITPVLALDALSTISLMWISGGGIFNRFTIAKRQRICLLMYTIAAVLCMAGQCVLFLMQGRPTVYGIRVNRQQICFIGAILCWAGLSLFLASFYIALRHKARELLVTQGFKDPQPLSYQDNGWGASGGGFEYWWLLGYIEVHSALQRKTAHSSGIADPSAYGSTTTPDSAELEYGLPSEHPLLGGHSGTSSPSDHCLRIISNRSLQRHGWSVVGRVAAYSPSRFGNHDSFFLNL